MKFRHRFASGFLTLLIVFSATAQQARRTCGTAPPAPGWDEWFNRKVEAFKAEKQVAKGQPVTLTIPVVVHVIHGGQSVATFPNLSPVQIRSQIKVLNDDFAGRGFGIANLAVTGFSAVGAVDTKITFCLAQYDPNGNQMAEPGIDRVNYVTQGWNNPAMYGTASTFQSYMDGTIKPATIWDPTYYFNIWVSDVNPSAYLLGYATFPGGSGLSGLNSNFGSGTNDGIWIWGKAFGNAGLLDGTYNRGRTAVHETGHWLGLRHIGGDALASAGDCNATDYCSDTPPQKGGNAGGTNGQNFGSPVYPLHTNVCGSQYGDMFMNFMDYSDDAVLNMFTPDQNDRMQAAMQNGYFRSQLSVSSTTQCVGLPTFDFNDVQSGCTNAEQPLDFTFSGIAGTFTWSAEPAGVVFSPNANAANPVISYPGQGTYTITVVTTNSIGTTSSQAVVEAAVCTGLQKLQAGDFIRISPVPVNTQLTVRWPDGGSASESMKIKLVDGFGRELINTSLSGQESGIYTLNTELIPDGIYFVSLERGETRLVKRVVVAH